MIEIRHVGIYVNDLNKMKEFYCKFLGMSEAIHAIEEGTYINTVLGLDNSKVELYKLKADDGSILELLKLFPEEIEKLEHKIYNIGSMHIAITVNNLNEEYLKLSKMGVKFISSPRFSSDCSAKVCFCRDPEGNFLELVEVLK